MSISCPVCGELMSSVPAGVCGVDVCPHCGGVWFDHDELKRIIEGNPGDLVAVDRPAPREPAGTAERCPGCPTTLQDLHFPRLRWFVGRVCPGCRGLWLDGGQVGQIREYLQRRASSASACVSRQAEMSGILAGVTTSALCAENVSSGESGLLAGAAGDVAEVVVDVVAQSVFDLVLQAIACLVENAFDAITGH